MIFLPLVAIGLYAVLTRAFVGRLAPWRPLARPHQHIEANPASIGWREWGVATGRTFFVGGVLGLEVAISLGQASEAVLLTSVAYAGSVALIGWLAERRTSRDRLAVMSMLNVLAAPALVAGIWPLSRSTEVTLASSGEVHAYEWAPAWLTLGAAVALLVVLAVSARRRRGRTEVSALERRAVALIAAPIALFVFMAALPGELGTFDAFEEGQALAASELVREGAFPWRDLMLTHGPLFDVGRGIVGLSVFEDSRWALVAADAVLLEPLAWIGLYYLCAYLLWTNWLLLFGTQLVVVTGHITAIETRMVLVPFCLLLLAALLAKPSVLRAASLTTLVVVQVVVTPESLVLAVAVFAVIAAFEFAYRAPGRGYPRMKLCLAALGAIAIGWAVFLAAFGALDDWLFSFAATIPGHRLTGGIPPLVPKTEFEVVAPIVLILVVYAFVVVRIRLRRSFAYQDWLLIAMGVLTVLYFTKFLGRMDGGHLDQSFAMAVPLLFYVAFRAITFGEAWLASHAAAHGLSRFPRRHVLTIPLLLILLGLSPTPLHDAVRAAPGHFSAEVGREPEVARIGYARPGESGAAALASVGSGLAALLEPGETVFDFSNSPGIFHYVLDLPPATRYYHVSFAIRQRTQSDLIRRLEASRPGAVVVGTDRTFNNLPAWDGAPNHVRHYDVSAYLLDHYVPVREVDGFVLMARRDRQPQLDPELYYRVDLCGWRNVPNFFSPRPSASAESVSLPFRRVEGSTQYAITLPEGSAGYGWLELRTGAPFAQADFDLSDQGGRSSRRSIGFSTLDRGETMVRVKVGACSQWRGYEPGTVYLSPSERRTSARFGWCGSSTGQSVACLERVTGGLRVAVEHPDGVERELVELATEVREPLQDLVGDRDDVAADRVRLDDVEHLARACPDQLLVRVRSEPLERGSS